MIDLEYEADSLLPPPPLQRLKDMESWVSKYWEKDVALPHSYVEHITAFHGGAPGLSCFRSSSGRTRSVGRFFNYLELSDLTPPLVPTWRQWSAQPDVRLDYRVDNFFNYEYWCERVGDYDFYPIAGLDTHGHNCRDIDEMSLLCLDFTQPGEPTVVIWNSPFDPVEFVSSSFGIFLEELERCSSLKIVEAEAF